MPKEGIPKFKSFAVNVWSIDSADKTDEEVAAVGVEALATFIKEAGLPTSFAEMGIPLTPTTSPWPTPATSPPAAARS